MQGKGEYKCRICVFLRIKYRRNTVDYLQAGLQFCLIKTNTPSHNPFNTGSAMNG